MRPPRYLETPVTSTVRPMCRPPHAVAENAGRYFLLRRWTRVRRSSLRCFFFAIRLRRFLITEPIKTIPISVKYV